MSKWRFHYKQQTPISGECLNTCRSSIVIILNLAKIGTLPLLMVVNSCTWLLSLSVLWTGFPELLYPFNPSPPPPCPSSAALCSVLPASLPPFHTVHFSPFGPALPSPEQRWGTKPLEAHLTPLCLSRICTWNCEKRNPGCERDIFAKLLYLSAFSIWFPVEAFNNVEWMISFRFD